MSEQILQRYEIQKQLGKKAGRNTVLAQDTQTGQMVIIKLLSFSNDFVWEDLKLFEREALTLKSVAHPAIPSYIDYFELEEGNRSCALVQTYIEGQSLQQYMQTGRLFTEDELQNIAGQLLQILIYLHEQHPPVIHRDIKPSNIILVENSVGNLKGEVGRVYLVDFGSVQTLASKAGKTVTVVGTYGYMPPEQFGGYATPASDLYSLGATLIALATLTHPADLPQKDMRLEQFGGRTKPASDIYSLGATLIYLVTGMHPTELPQQNLQIQFREFADIIPELADWLEWMTEPSLNKRFTSARVTKEAIDNPLPRTNTIQTQQLLDKPSKTKIDLIKTDEKLEIIMPPKGFGMGLISLISVVTPFALGVHFFPSSIYKVEVSSTLVSFYGFQASAIGFLLLLIIWGLFKTTQISIKLNHIIITHKLFWLKWHHIYKVDTSKISHVKVTSNQTNIKINPQLLLIASGITLLNFDKYSNLTDVERRWLAQEIEHWLKISALVESAEC